MGIHYGTMAAQAVMGLDVTHDGNVTRVRDAADVWLCWTDEWRDALDRLDAMPAITSPDGHEFECAAEAYGRLCGEVRGPVASVIGSSHGGDIGPLVREAVSLGMIEEETATSAYGVEVA